MQTMAMVRMGLFMAAMTSSPGPSRASSCGMPRKAPE